MTAKECLALDSVKHGQIPESHAGQQSLEWTSCDAIVSQQHHLLSGLPPAIGMLVVMSHLIISMLEDM